MGCININPPLGSDTLKAVEDTQAAWSAETEAWRTLGASTDFAAGESAVAAGVSFGTPPRRGG